MTSLDIIVLDACVLLDSANPLAMVHKEVTTKYHHEIAEKLVEALRLRPHVYISPHAKDALRANLTHEEFENSLRRAQYFRTIYCRSPTNFDKAMLTARETFDNITQHLRDTPSKYSSPAERTVRYKFLTNSVDEEDIVLLAMARYLKGAIGAANPSADIGTFLVSRDAHLSECHAGDYTCNIVPEIIKTRTGIECVMPRDMIAHLNLPSGPIISEEDILAYIAAGKKATELIAAANKIFEKDNRRRRR